jgi:hypothetical protein
MSRLSLSEEGIEFWLESGGGRDSGAKPIMLTARGSKAGRCKMKPTGTTKKV